MYNFALIGCGRIAARHAENISKVGRLLAVCDVVPERAATFSKTYGATAYETIDDLLQHEKDVHVVSICTPNGLHAEHAIKALRSGKHVLCEKPMSLTSTEAWQMIDAANLFDRRLFIVKQNRLNPPVAFLKNLINENKLGTPHFFQVNGFWNRPQEYYTGDWKGTIDLDGGILYTQFSHFIDLVYWMLGDIKTVSAMSKNCMKRVNMAFDDTIIVMAEMENGCIGTMNFTVNSYKKNMEGSFTLIAENATIKIGGQYLNELEWLSGKDLFAPALVKSNAANDYGSYTGSMSNHGHVYEHLIQALNQKTNNIPEGFEGAKTVEIIERIYQASLPRIEP